MMDHWYVSHMALDVTGKWRDYGIAGCFVCRSMTWTASCSTPTDCVRPRYARFNPVIISYRTRVKRLDTLDRLCSIGRVYRELTALNTVRRTIRVLTKRFDRGPQ